MIRSKEELLSAIKSIMPDDSTDEALKVFEDLSDTLENNNNKDNEDWKTKYEENDKMWRERYRDRFFSGEPSPARTNTEEDNPVDEPEENEPMTFDDLFK